MAEPSATWVYAVVPNEIADVPAGVTGVAGEPIRLVRRADLAAAVGSVPLEEMDEQPLRRRLQDPAWLEHAVRSHHQVVSAFLPRAPTVPFRLATVYHSDAQLAQMLDHRAPELLDALETVAGRAEWGVQAYAEPGGEAPAEDAAAPAGSPAGASGGSSTTRPGTEYLLRRRAERSQQQQARAAASAAAQQADAVLAAMAVAVHRSPPARRPGDGPSAALVLNTSYLVDDGRAAEFTGSVDQLADRFPQLRLRLTGPWPAYSFVHVGEAVDTGEAVDIGEAGEAGS